MMLGNLGLFLLAPFLGFGVSDGNAFAQANSSSDWREAVSEWRSSSSDNNWRRSPTINRISPDEGPVGTEVTLRGTRFSDDSIVRMGDGMITDVDASNNGRTLTFTIPDYMGEYCPPDEACTMIAHEVDPGDYEIRVVNDDERTSNSVTFTVTGEDNGDGLAIDTIDGPTALDPGAEGSWTVNVSGASSSLSYSVKWGDEGLMSRMMSLDEGQASATFTHRYDEPGTYTPEFTVTNADGDTVSKQAAEVTVGDDGTVHIDAIDPSTARASTTVTLTGHGFDGDTKVWVGRHEGQQVDVDSDTSLSFVVPAIAAGNYRVSVESDEGRSNAIALKVEAKVKGKVSVSGVDAPTRLAVDQEGTWTVKASSNTDGNLQYSVDWGDSDMNMARNMSGETTQSSASFTHSYSEPGTYHPKFTVTDEDGNKSSVSASVVVR